MSLPKVLTSERADRGRGGLAVEVLTEAVAHAILAGGVVGTGDAAHEQHLFALRQLVQRDRDRTRGAAGDHHRLVLADEALLRLHRFVRLGRGVRDAVLQFLAENTLGGLGRDLLDQLMAAVDVLDREFVALEFVFALHRIGAGARHGNTDENRGAGRTRPDRSRSPACRRHRPASPSRREASFRRPIRRRTATACDGTPRGRNSVRQLCFSRPILPIFIVTRPAMAGRSDECSANAGGLVQGRTLRGAVAGISLHDMSPVNVTFVARGRICRGNYIVLRYIPVRMVRCGRRPNGCVFGAAEAWLVRPWTGGQHDGERWRELAQSTRKRRGTGKRRPRPEPTAVPAALRRRFPAAGQCDCVPTAHVPAD